MSIKKDEPEKALSDSKFRVKKDKKFNPLVICGPPCSGKVRAKKN